MDDQVPDCLGLTGRDEASRPFPGMQPAGELLTRSCVIALISCLAIAVRSFLQCLPLDPRPLPPFHFCTCLNLPFPGLSFQEFRLQWADEIESSTS